MRYFTPQVEDEHEAQAAYVRRLEELGPRLPEPVRLLAHELELHDAVIVSVVWDARVRELRLTFTAV